MNEQNTSVEKKAIQATIGRVVSDKMHKTIVVLVERKVPHIKYKKYIRKTTKLFAQDEEEQCRIGDKVLIESCRPLSKNKCWKLVKVLEKVESIIPESTEE